MKFVMVAIEVLIVYASCKIDYGVDNLFKYAGLSMSLILKFNFIYMLAYL